MICGGPTDPEVVIIFPETVVVGDVVVVFETILTVGSPDVVGDSAPGLVWACKSRPEMQVIMTTKVTPARRTKFSKMSSTAKGQKPGLFSRSVS